MFRHVQEAGKPRMRRKWSRLSVGLIVIILLTLMASEALSAQAITLPAPVQVVPSPIPQPGQPASPEADDNLSEKLVAGSVTMAVQAGFNGYALIGSWIPVRVALANGGADTKVVVRVRAQMENSSVEYASPVSLAKGAKKEVVLTYPMSQMISSVTVELVTEDGKSLGKARAPLQTSAMSDVFVGILANDPATGRYLGAVTLPMGKFRVTPISLRAGDIPTNSVLLDSFQAIIVNDFAATDLEPGQWRALQNWASAGGALFITGGPSWSKTFTGLPETLRPGQVSGVVTAPSLASLENYAGKKISGGATALLAKLAPARGSEILVGSAELPLVTRRTLGLGSLLYVAFDLNLEPFAGWAGSPTLWERLLGQTASQQMAQVNMKGGYGYKVPKRQNQIAWAVRNIDAAQIPPASAVGGIILLYILALGPVNYLILKKLDRRHLTWITVPLIAVLFATGVWFIAFKDKGRDLIANSISVVRFATGSSTARVDTYASLFAPSRSSFRVSVKGDPVVSSLPYSDGPYANGQQVVARVTRSADTNVELLDMNLWTIRGFLAEQDADLGGTITADLKTEGDRVVGVIRNQTPYELKDCAIVAGTAFQKIDSLPAGGEAKVDLQVGLPSGYLGSLPSQIYGQAQTVYPGGPKGGMTPPDRSAQRKIQTLDGLIQTGGLGGPVSFVGWAESSLGLLRTTQTKDDGQRNLSLLTTGLDVSYGSGDSLSVPPGLVRSRVIDSTGNTGYFPDGLYVGDGQMTFQLDAGPALRQAKVLQLNLPTDHNQSVFKAPGLVVEVWDWQSSSWTKIAPDETVGLSDPARYVSEAGTVRVRITNDNRQGVNMRLLTLTASGR